MKLTNVVSLFDGMSCGQISLNKAGIKYDNYYASEIDKHAMNVALDNYPNTKMLGSVIALTEEDLLSLGKIDLLIGGSPCQGFSVAGNMKGSVTKEGIDVVSLEQYLDLKEKGFEFDGQSYLFWEYMRVLSIVKPKYFLLENVRVTKKWLPMFNKAMGIEPIMINSRLVSAQNRVRYYWTNIPNVEQPADRGIILTDILEDIVGEEYQQGKVLCGASRGRYIVDGKRQDGKMLTAGLTQQMLEVRPDKKTNCLTTVAKDNLVVMGLEHGDRIPLLEIREATYRKFTVTECERLQTVPDGYTEVVSNTQRLKMLGNGWTIDVIVHIINNLK